MFNPLRELNTYRFSGPSGAHDLGRVRSVGPIRNVLTGEPWSRSQKSCPCLAFVESQHFAIIFRSESTKHSRRLVCQHRSYGRGREPGPKCPGRGEGRELEWNVCPGPCLLFPLLDSSYCFRELQGRDFSCPIYVRLACGPSISFAPDGEVIPPELRLLLFKDLHESPPMQPARKALVCSSGYIPEERRHRSGFCAGFYILWPVPFIAPALQRGRRTAQDLGGFFGAH